MGIGVWVGLGTDHFVVWLLLAVVGGWNRQVLIGVEVLSENLLKQQVCMFSPQIFKVKFP